VPTDDGGHIQALCGDFVEIISMAKADALPPHPIDHAIDLEPSYNLPYGRIIIERSFQFSWVQSSGIHPIACIKIMSSRSRIMDLDIQILCHMGGLMGRYFLRMDDKTPDYGTAMKSQWKGDIMEVSKDDL